MVRHDMEKRFNYANMAVRAGLFFLRPSFTAFVIRSLVFVCIALGVWWAVFTDDWANLSRMGSVIVIISLLTYTGSVKRAQKRLEKIAALTMDVSVQVNSGGNNLSVEDQKAINRAGHVFGQNLNKLQVQVANLNSEENDKIVKRLALRSAILGTFIWGFGDLINLL